MARSDYFALRLLSGPELKVEFRNLEFLNRTMKDMRTAAQIAANLISYKQLVSTVDEEATYAMAGRLSELSDVAEFTGSKFAFNCGYTSEREHFEEALHRYGVASVFKGLSLRFNLPHLFEISKEDHAFFRDYATLALLEMMAKSNKRFMPIKVGRSVDTFFEEKQHEFLECANQQNQRVVMLVYDYIGEMRQKN